MSYVVSVGGDPINPNPFDYSQISMTGNISLVWPSNTQDATYTGTNWVDIASSAAYTMKMPPANEAAEGAQVVFYNYGSFTITINDSVGGGITTVASGLTKRVWITDNSTAAGTWRVANIGSGTTVADASMLAGYGLVAQASQLSQSMLVVPYSTDVTLNAGSRAYLADWIGGSGTFSLTSPATLGNGWFSGVKNSGSGTLTLNGNGATIDGSSTLTIAVSQGFTVATDGSNFYTVGRPILTTPTVTQISKAVGGSSDVTLTAAEALYSIINFTGVLTGNINVVVPSNVNEWLMYNNTTGAYTLIVKTSGGSGVAITQSTRRLLYCDATNVNFSDSVGTGTVTNIATGTGLNGGPISTTGILSLANTAVTAGVYQMLNATIDQQGRITAAASATTLTQLIAPGASGNFLRSTGTDWTSAGISSFNSYLTSDVSLSNTATYFDGPAVAQGTSGTFLAIGTITVLDTSGAAVIDVKLWDGTTILGSSEVTTLGTSISYPIALSGVITNPVGNLRISAKDRSFANGKIAFNTSGNSRDSNITVVKIG